MHKVQGMSLGEIIFTMGSKKMIGTAYTAFTRSRGGLADILLDTWDTESFLRIFNDKVDDKFKED